MDEILDGHDSDRTIEQVHRDCLLSVSHSQFLWRRFVGRRLAFCAIGEEGSEVAYCHV